MYKYNSIAVIINISFPVMNQEAPSLRDIKLNLSHELEMQYELLDVEDVKYYKGEHLFSKYRSFPIFGMHIKALSINFIALKHSHCV